MVDSRLAALLFVIFSLEGAKREIAGKISVLSTNKDNLNNFKMNFEDIA